MAVPGTPTGYILQQANGQVLLSWELMAGATSYKVQKSTDGVSYSTLATPATNFYLDTAVTVGTLYYYQVASTNGSGDSSYATPQNIVPTMNGQMALGQIRLAAQQRADMQNSNFVKTVEWNSYINQSAFELYDLLTTLYEDFYLAPCVLLQTDGTSQDYDLPDGIEEFMDMEGAEFVAKPFYKLAGVDCGLALNSNAWVTLKKFNFISRNRYVFPNITSTYLGVFNLRYRLLDNHISFIPTPSAGQFIRIWYVPRMTQLLADNDILDGVSGWTEYVIVDAAIKAMQKEESDASLLMAQKQALLDRIMATAMNRDQGQPDTISDTRSRAEAWGVYGPPNGDGSFGGF